MKGITGYLCGALVLLSLGGVCLAVSMLERQLADAQQRVNTSHYEGVDATLASVERYFEYGSRLPWVGNGPLNAVRARRAEVQYWQRQYGSIVPQQEDPIGVIAVDNLALQLVVANAVYRMARTEATDQATTLQAVEAGIDAYLAVLRNATQHETAAFNYEYLVRLRDDIEDGGDLSEQDAGGQFGEAGSVPEEEGAENFKIRVPLENEEMSLPGSGISIQRQG